MNRFRWNILTVVIDAVLIGAALYAALYLRFDGLIPAHYLLAYRQLVLYFTAAQMLLFYFFGFYNRLWQYASTGELILIAGSITAGAAMNLLVLVVSAREGAFLLPRSVLVLHWMIMILVIGFSRFSWRFLKGYLFRRRKPGDLKHILIVGAGDAGATLVRELKQRRFQDNLVPVGFVDDNPAKQRMGMFGLPVLGKREDIPRLVQRYAVDEIVIAIPSADRGVIAEIVDICQTTVASLKILPGIYELVNGRVTVSQIREVKVEDILGREPVEVDLEAIAGYLTDKTVLVTGAGGSIGSELCRQVAGFRPQRLLLLGRGENSIYDIYQELGMVHGELEIIPAIIDVREAVPLAKIFQQYRPEVVFHAAAHKHVPLMEQYPAEALKNNILGTFNAARAAHDCGAEAFILVSTDKAVHPSSVMGASKRIAEMVVQQLARSSRTCFAAVRFGNVLDSRGSVVPLFKKQIAAGGPVTVTHPEMVRYFMTIPEAVQLVIQAGALARGGEIFVLDMGEPVKILSLARQMIRLAGYQPGGEIPIVFTGIRPGEKLSEELLTGEEEMETTLHQSIFVAGPNNGDAGEMELQRLLKTISASGWNPSSEGVAELLRSLLPAFPNSPKEEGRLSAEDSRVYQ
ncbi:MAG: polysaccharide biosynthesis protein [Firmicutes bacterium]|nr:polysaccharide biosynthesis protein [Bacillota bacterium]